VGYSLASFSSTSSNPEKKEYILVLFSNFQLVLYVHNLSLNLCN
jgi:hypothetical protein